jgi:hypothetical protein
MIYSYNSILHFFIDYKNEDDSQVNQIFEMNTKNLFLYKDEQLVLVEENLSYFNEKTAAKNGLDQFNFINIANISDIVHLVNIL